VNISKKLAVVALVETFFLPACSKSNIEQITGTATSTTEQTKEATQIVEEGKKEKENTYLSKIKSCWGWTWQNKEYIAGGAVAVVAIGLIAWGAVRDASLSKSKTDPDAQPANPPKESKLPEEKANSAPTSTHSSAKGSKDEEKSDEYSYSSDDIPQDDLLDENAANPVDKPPKVHGNHHFSHHRTEQEKEDAKKAREKKTPPPEKEPAKENNDNEV